MQLDSQQLFQNDYRLLAEKIGFSNAEIARLTILANRSTDSITLAIIKHWSTRRDSLLGKLLDILEEMERADVADDLKEVVEKKMLTTCYPYLSRSSKMSGVHKDFCYHLRQLCTALVGIWNSLHHFLETPYHGPIDWSPISISFFLLSWGKELLLVWIIPTGLFKLFTTVDVCFAKFLTMMLILLLAQVAENKWVSPEVGFMRQELLSLTSNSLREMRIPSVEVASQIKALHESIRRKLVVSLTMEMFLLPLPLIWIPSCKDHSPEVVQFAYLVCLVEFLLTMFVFWRHYRRAEVCLLDGRFRLDGLFHKNCYQEEVMLV
ncbi:uncharacterized protein LOC106162137 isoform X2 [Lingula anatina]|nr:uncharacterized protein LOC106162137 isoform X2 [Lingula anatina]|eukprot:XP_013394735.1 uncharacterized protein LOC106162137 isoform X2 [Lingula anatina]